MNARDYALALLDRTALPGWATKQIRRKVEPPTDPRDLGLAEQIRIGVIKNHAFLDYLIDHYSGPRPKIDPLVRKILAIALYQIRFLTRIPAAAAVDEAVEQARRFGRRHAAGFVNGLLRQATRQPDVPLPDLPDDPEKYAEIVLSHPSEFFGRLVELLGIERAIQFCKHDNIEPPTLVRVLHGAAFPPQPLPEGVEVTSHEQSGIFVVEGARRAQFAQWAEAGLAQVQDATAARVVQRMDLHPGHDALDRCSGLGTKTLQIREHLETSGWIMAMDPSEPRCNSLRKLLARRGIDNIAVVQASMLRQVSELKKPAFDRILIDVPCSNSGVLARRPEARYAQTADALASLGKLQEQIMDDTAAYLRAGGILVYSTCSVWPSENEQRVRRFLENHREYELIDSQMTLPSFEPQPQRYRDGGYLAVLHRP